jgi:protein-tyrosine phosphatase
LIDLHCHILPGVDDGPDSMEESLEMANQAAADGIHTLVATPHTHNGVYHNSLHHTENNVARLRNALRKNRIHINLCIGSEVRICTGLKQKVIAKEIATLNNTGRYILVEFPVHVIPPGSKEELFQLTLHNITPILAHPERNMVFQDQPELLFDLTAMGCLVQITAMSITGNFGRDAMECAHMLLKNRQSHIIATDAHSPVKRPPILSPAVKTCAQILGNLEQAREMVASRPRAILNGEPVKITEYRAICKKKWWFIRGLKN